jgi:ribosomal protein L6P/L9E
MLSVLSKNITTYCFLQNKKLFLLVLTSSKGWGINSYQKPYFLVKEKKVFYLSYTKSYSSFISIIFLGFQKGYFQYLKLKGIGYKFIHTINNIILKFGFSHRIIYINSIDTECRFISRYLLSLEARSLWTLKKIVQSFNNIRKKNVYKKKGLFLKGSLISILASSKKSKF